MAIAPRLVVIEPNGQRRSVTITASPFRIGRQAGNELTLRDTRISRQQARILAHEGVWVLEDMGSRHGTRVNGETILRHVLQPNDRVDFGMADSFTLVYEGEGATIGELVERVEAPAPANAGSRELYHLGVLLEVARTLGAGLSLEDVLTTVVDAAIELTRTERGVLLLANAAGELQTSVARDAKRGTLRPDHVQVSRSVVERVANTRRELIVSDPGEGFNPQQSIAQLQLRTVVAIPVEKLPVIEELDVTITARQSTLLGVLYLDSRAPSAAFSDLDRQVLRALAREAGAVVENARLFAASRAKQRLEHEIEIASDIQRQLLPKALPDLPGLAAAATTLPCYSVAGDCFDVIDLGKGRYGFFVGDVSGKGISAALLAASLQGVFFTVAGTDVPLPALFTRVNQYLCERSSADRFATVFYGVLDPAGRLEYVNAGHVPPLVRRRDGTLEALPAENLPVGIFCEEQYRSASVTLEPGEFLVIYTDGVSEAANLQNELFDESRLRGILENFLAATAAEMAAAIREQVRAFTEGAPQSDDITILVVHFKGGAA